MAPNQYRPPEPVDRNHHLQPKTNQTQQRPHPLLDSSSSQDPGSNTTCDLTSSRTHESADLAGSHAARPPWIVKPLVACLRAKEFRQPLMAPQRLHTLRLSALASHAVCKCSAAPLFRKRMPLVVAFPRAGSGGAVASCSAVQESSTSTTVSEKKDAADDKKATTAAAKPAAKPKKAPAKPLPEMMQEEIIPPLKAALEAEENVSQVELSFQNNTLEGSFIKDDVPYYFWAFFPKGDLTGPKGFALSSYSNEVSTIEPFLIDEKRITAKYVVFWVYKRLAGQGILPVWKEEEGEGEAAEK